MKKNKEEKKDKVPKEKKMSDGQKLDLLLGAVSKLVDVMQHQPIPGTVVAPGVDVPTQTASVKGYSPQFDDETYPKSYLPPKFRKLVTEILSDEFGARVNDFEDRTEFQFDIIVPVKYSSLTKEDKEKGVQDIRTRIIPRSLGENGVKEWCMLVRKNLNRFYQQEGKSSPFANAAEE